MDVFSKIDLHIHSAASGKTKAGDKEITKNSTINNIDILIKKLNDNDVNVCAITDHNYFDKELYLKLKESEGKSKLKKVLPGVELDLEINSKIVHTICIFNDFNPNHADIIENNFVIKDKYTLSELGTLLANIGLDVVLIAHQKTDYLAENQHPTNLSSCGIETFYKMIDLEYFDSLEVQSSKVEGILRNRFFKDRIMNQTLISGSDCHDWSVYPLHDKNKMKLPLLISMKSEPSFRGLVMAITNIKRFFVSNFSNRTPAIKSIKMKLNNENIEIPLSYGINAIIGDNSVGKSTLVKALLNKNVSYLNQFYSNYNIFVEPANLNESDYTFNSQGEVRSKFENSDTKLSIKEEFKNQIKEINIKPYENTISHIFDRFINLWNNNEEVHINNNKLKDKFVISAYDNEKSYFLSFKSLCMEKENKYCGITSSLYELIENLTEVGKNFKNTMDNDDINELRMIYKSLTNIKNKYTSLELKFIFDNKIINCINNVVENYNRHTESQKSTEEESYNSFLSNVNTFTTEFARKFKFDNKKLIDPFNDFEKIKIIPVDNVIGDYHFITKPIYNELIDRDCIINFIKTKIDIFDIFVATKSEILNNIRGKKFNEKVCNNLIELKKSLLEEFKNNYFKTTIEIKHGNDNLDEGNSAGINALYYLDIESYIYNKKLFVIDQPEDDVSQTKINSILLSSLRNFAKKSQVILITHNPQLVVNLDVDNVIVIKKNDDNKLYFAHGPLERLDEKVDMIKLVAETLEGGIEVIKKRWKRYDKTN